jgi:hypothetical protein
LSHEQAKRNGEQNRTDVSDAGALQADGDVFEQRAAGETSPERRKDRVDRGKDRRIDPALAAGDLPERQKAEQRAVPRQEAPHLRADHRPLADATIGFEASNKDLPLYFQAHSKLLLWRTRALAAPIDG